MCHESCIAFGQVNLKEEEIRGKSVIEVGALDVNGSLRPLVEALSPQSYLGVDIQPGPGVDQICDAQELLERFGPESFDWLIATELLEHVEDWRKVISNFKSILKPQGRLLITTRSRGFAHHEYPDDFWRYEVFDMEVIFSDFMIEVLEPDPQAPGVFIKARKPLNFREYDLSHYRLFSIIKGCCTKNITKADLRRFKK